MNAFALLFLFVSILPLHAAEVSPVISIRMEEIPVRVMPFVTRMLCPDCVSFVPGDTPQSADRHLSRTGKHAMASTHPHEDSARTYSEPADDERYEWLIQEELKHTGTYRCTFDERGQEQCEPHVNKVTRRALVPKHAKSRMKTNLYAEVVSTVALALAVAAHIRIDSLERTMNEGFAEIEEKMKAQAKLNMEIFDAIRRAERNGIIRTGLAAISAGETEVRLRAMAMRQEHVPAWLAIEAEHLARDEGLRTPLRMTSTGPLPRRADLKAPTRYLGLVDDDDGFVSVMNVSDSCNFKPYIIADIQEQFFPWGVAAYFATVYYVSPLAPESTFSQQKTCTGESILASERQNAGCFSDAGADNIERARRVALYMADDYRVRIPLSFHSSRQSLNRQYKFTKYGFVNPNTIPDGCSQNKWSIWFPLTKAPGPTIQRKPKPNEQCFVQSSWNAAYTNLCATQRTQVGSGDVYIVPTQPNGEYPAFEGVVSQELGGIMTFRTLGISEQTIKVYLLTRNSVFYYNTTTGLSRSPEFYDEWVTEDGRSVPNTLMQQYYTLGLTRGSIARSQLSYIPANVYTLSQGKACTNEACTRNQAAYYWDGKKYGEPKYTEVIAPVSKPLPCDAVFDCETVGPPAVAAGKTPKTCDSISALACCNVDGYVCFIKINGSSNFAEQIERSVNATIISFRKLMDQLQEQNLTLADYTYILQLENTTKAVNDILLKELPRSNTRINLLESGFAFIKDAAEFAKDTVNEINDKIKNMFLSPFGFGSGILNTIGLIVYIIIIVVIIICAMKAISNAQGGGGVPYSKV